MSVFRDGKESTENCIPMSDDESSDDSVAEDEEAEGEGPPLGKCFKSDEDDEIDEEDEDGDSGEEEDHGEASEHDPSEDDEDVAMQDSVRWKSNLAQKAADAFLERQSSSQSLWKLVYGKFLFYYFVNLEG